MDGSLLRSHDVQRINGVWEYFAFSPATYTVSYPFALCFRRAVIPNFLKWSFFQIADSLASLDICRKSPVASARLVNGSCRNHSNVSPIRYR